jgi:hypothetical protein
MISPLFAPRKLSLPPFDLAAPSRVPWRDPLQSLALPRNSPHPRPPHLSQAGETRQVKLSLCAPVSPRLAPLLSLLGRAAALSPPPLARISSLLSLLSSLVRSVGSELGGRFVIDALTATLRAVGSAAAALSHPAGAACDPDAVEAFLRSSIGVLREAADPPLHRAPERAELLACVLTALGPHALGGLLSPAAALRLSDSSYATAGGGTFLTFVHHAC